MMTGRDALMLGWWGFMIGTLLLGAFVSSWFLLGTGIVLFAGSCLPRKVLKIIRSSGVSLFFKEKKNK